MTPGRQHCLHPHDQLSVCVKTAGPTEKTPKMNRSSDFKTSSSGTIVLSSLIFSSVVSHWPVVSSLPGLLL